MANKIPTALVSDFDDTISDDDFFNYVSRRCWAKSAGSLAGIYGGKKDSF